MEETKFYKELSEFAGKDHARELCSNIFKYPENRWINRDDIHGSDTSAFEYCRDGMLVEVKVPMKYDYDTYYLYRKDCDYEKTFNSQVVKKCCITQLSKISERKYRVEIQVNGETYSYISCDEDLIIKFQDNCDEGQLHKASKALIRICEACLDANLVKYDRVEIDSLFN